MVRFQDLKVGLIAERFSLDSGVGTERYSEELAQRLNGNCIRIASNPSRKRFALTLNATVKLPLKIALMDRPLDIYHATDPSSAICLGLTLMPTVVTFHDLLHFRDEGFAGKFARFAYKKAAKCDRIIAVSEQTKKDLVYVLEVEPSKITVTNEGISDSFRVIPNIKKKALIAHVGDINPRKRLELVLEIFARLKKLVPEANLEFIGSPIASYLSPYRDKLVKMASENDIKEICFSGRVSEEVLVQKFNEATLTILTSSEEGFGFSILESQRCGTPCVVLKDSRISPEVKKAAVVADGIEEAVSACYRLIVDESYTKKVIEAGLAHAAMFRWDDCVRKTIDVYSELLR